MASGTFVGYPSSFDETNSDINGSSNLANAYDADSSTNYAQFTTNAGWNAVTTIFFDFDCSSIPASATIESVACSVKCSHTSTFSSEVFTATSIQLYEGTETEKGAASTFSASAASHSLTTGTWTRAELDNIKLKIAATRGIKNMTNTYYIRVYGATLTINYTYNGESVTSVMYIKNNGTWVAHNKVYQKTNGTWEEITFDELDFDTNTKLIRGGSN